MPQGERESLNLLRQNPNFYFYWNYLKYLSEFAEFLTGNNQLRRHRTIVRLQKSTILFVRSQAPRVHRKLHSAINLGGQISVAMGAFISRQHDAELQMDRTRTDSCAVRVGRRATEFVQHVHIAGRQCLEQGVSS